MLIWLWLIITYFFADMAVKKVVLANLFQMQEVIVQAKLISYQIFASQYFGQSLTSHSFFDLCKILILSHRTQRYTAA